MMRPASNAALSGSKPLMPWAMASALTNGMTLSVSASSARDAVVLPAPLMPASMMARSRPEALMETPVPSWFKFE